MCEYSAITKAIENYIMKVNDDLEKTLDDEGYADSKETVETANRIEDAISDALDNQTDAFVKSLEDADEQAIRLDIYFADIWPEFKENDIFDKAVLQLFFDELNNMFPKLVNDYIMETDKELVVDQLTKRTTDWIKSWSEELADIMNLSSHEELEKVLLDGMEEGKSISELTQEILDGDIRNTRYKARRVAITETLRAHSYAKEESIRQSPAASGKEWVHTGGYRNEPRQNHVDMDGQIVGKDEHFTLIGKNAKTYEPLFPRDIILPPSESINCHCLHRAVVDEKVLGLSLEERKRLQAEIIAEDNKAWEAETTADAESE